MTDHVQQLKPRTAREYRRLIETLLKPRLGRLPIREITSNDVSEAYQAWRSKPTQASFAVRVLSSAMSLAEQWKLRGDGTNPCWICMKASRRREYLFSDAQVARLLQAIDELEMAKTRKGRISPSVALALRLLFATGCRADEIPSLEWCNVDFEEGVMRWGDFETGYWEKPITDEVLPLLQAAPRFNGIPWVCPSPN